MVSDSVCEWVWNLARTVLAVLTSSVPTLPSDVESTHSLLVFVQRKYSVMLYSHSFTCFLAGKYTMDHEIGLGALGAEVSFSVLLGTDRWDQTNISMNLSDVRLSMGTLIAMDEVGLVLP